MQPDGKYPVIYFAGKRDSFLKYLDTLIGYYGQHTKLSQVTPQFFPGGSWK